MKTSKLFIAVSLIFFTQINKAQNSVSFTYSGLDPNEMSPFIQNENASHGIHNPERGFEVRGGVIDIFTYSFSPNSNEFSYEQYNIRGNSFYSNVLGDPAMDWMNIKDYIDANYADDGISLIEIEEYVHFSESNLINQPGIRQADIDNANSIFQVLKDYGLKARLVTNSTFQLFDNIPGGLANNIADSYAPYKLNNPQYNTRVSGLNYYIDQMSSHYSTISPFVANIQVGWTSFPWDFNTYRHSTKWLNSGFERPYRYYVGYEKSLAHAGSNALYTNEKSDYRESKQKFDWNIAHGNADGWNYSTKYNQVREDIITGMLNAFPNQKLLLSSMTPWTNYIGTKIYQNGGGINSTINASIIRKFYDNVETPAYLTSLRADNKYQRIGFYDGFFVGDSYDHAFGIASGYANHIHWHANYFTSNTTIGTDWVDNYLNTDTYLLRKYRENMWMHGELPLFETTDQNVNINTTGNWGRSFQKRFNYMYNWYEGNPVQPRQYPYEVAEKATDGRLQEGLYSALKMRYFNFTSFGISNNHLLDGRSYYELKENQTSIVVQGNLNPLPNASNTVVNSWKVPYPDLVDSLHKYGMPFNKDYFSKDRSVYEYIRDHLGYRLELMGSYVSSDYQNVDFTIKLKNIGFAAPQNPRDFKLVILDYYTNAILYELNPNNNSDWRDWQPDQFSTSIDNADNTTWQVANGSDTNFSTGTLNSLEGKVVGGLPLGDFGDNWHRVPFVNYQANTHILSYQIPWYLLQDGKFKFGLMAPDNSSSLSNNTDFHVKFANQLPYYHQNGIHILGTFNYYYGDLSNTEDADGDGIPNVKDKHPYNPKDYNGASHSFITNNSNGFEN
jgi:hypothetical protein